jgi:hypothetical protein
VLSKRSATELGIRERILRKVAIAGRFKEEIGPDWYMFMVRVLFPIRSMYLKNTKIKWEPQTDIYIIDGVRLTRQLFRAMCVPPTAGKYRLFKIWAEEESKEVNITEVAPFSGTVLPDTTFVQSIRQTHIVSIEREGTKYEITAIIDRGIMTELRIVRKPRTLFSEQVGLDHPMYYKVRAIVEEYFNRIIWNPTASQTQK